MNKDKKELVSAYTHLGGAILSIAGFFALLFKGLKTNDFTIEISAIIFGLSMIFLYSMSATYHMIDSSKTKTKLVLRKIDHIMIFFLIAGTYTPICLIAFKDLLIGKILLIVVWSITLIGLFIKLFWINAPRWVCSGLYIAMGWAAIFAIKPIITYFDSAVIFWLFAGGIIYTVGGVIYGLKKPNFNFKNFGFHELFHIFILLGSLCHFIMIYCYVI
ncbi:MAG TPA: hemolysin [Clostridiales bacterium]|nr:hemolysin [Clostridiales bacterium]